MTSERTKALLFVTWAVTVFLAAIALGASSLLQWIVVASVAVVPPAVARVFWRAPDLTMSEVIDDARR